MSFKQAFLYLILVCSFGAPALADDGSVRIATAPNELLIPSLEERGDRVPLRRHFADLNDFGYYALARVQAGQKIPEGIAAGLVRVFLVDDLGISLVKERHKFSHASKAENDLLELFYDVAGQCVHEDCNEFTPAREYGLWQQLVPRIENAIHNQDHSGLVTAFDCALRDLAAEDYEQRYLDCYTGFGSGPAEVADGSGT